MQEESGNHQFYFSAPAVHQQNSNRPFDIRYIARSYLNEVFRHDVPLQPPSSQMQCVSLTFVPCWVFCLACATTYCAFHRRDGVCEIAEYAESCPFQHVRLSKNWLAFPEWRKLNKHGAFLFGAEHALTMRACFVHRRHIKMFVAQIGNQFLWFHCCLAIIRVGQAVKNTIVLSVSFFPDHQASLQYLTTRYSPDVAGLQRYSDKHALCLCFQVCF